ncbi:RidA family protein [Streptomyces xiaopingdaonensis]|uniref:RidA family protein n=1 Tax=Streptomyces xiaopingdaonensis TaxID=1565415 RepID=UPI00030DA7F3|nr:Rid family hydrolase [Streptomyces xiaopingdaonensis]
MAVTLLHPEGLPRIDLYRHVSVATGSKLVSVAGQVSWDEDGATVGAGDLAAQVEQCYVNAATALAAAGATFDDVVRLKVYVAGGWTSDRMPLFEEGVARAAARLGTRPTPPITLIGVVSLDIPDHLVELEVTAVVE